MEPSRLLATSPFICLVMMEITSFTIVKETAMAGLEPSTLVTKGQHGVLEPRRLRDVEFFLVN